MSDRRVIPADRPLETVQQVVRYALEGATSDELRAVLAEVARDAGEASRGGGVELLPRAVRELRRRYSYLPDPLGHDVVQAVPLTLAVGAGDCDDATALAAAAAIALGLPARVVLVSIPDGDALRAVHLYAQAHDGSSWRDLDLTLREGEPLALPRGAVLEFWDVPAGPAGIGWIEQIIGGALSIFGGNSQAKAARDAARYQADATRSQSMATREAARLEAAAYRQASADQLGIARIQAELDAQRLAAAERATDDVLRLARQLAPAVIAFLVVKAAAPLAQQLVGKL